MKQHLLNFLIEKFDCTYPLEAVIHDAIKNDNDVINLTKPDPRNLALPHSLQKKALMLVGVSSLLGSKIPNTIVTISFKSEIEHGRLNAIKLWALKRGDITKELHQCAPLVTFTKTNEILILSKEGGILKYDIDKHEVYRISEPISVCGESFARNIGCMTVVYENSKSIKVLQQNAHTRHLCTDGFFKYIPLTDCEIVIDVPTKKNTSNHEQTKLNGYKISNVIENIIFKLHLPPHDFIKHVEIVFKNNNYMIIFVLLTGENESLHFYTCPKLITHHGYQGANTN